MRYLIRTLLCLLLTVAGMEVWAHQRSVTDLAERTVVLPEQVTLTATLGAVAPLNSFLFMLGKSDSIGNGLPVFFQTPYWAMQHRLAPRLVSQPIVAASDGLPNLETLLALAPSVVLTSSKGALPVLDAAHLPVLFFEWKNIDDLMRSADLLGEVFHANERAANYRRYCERNVARVNQALAAGKPVRQRPRIAFLRMKTLSQPARIADWTLSAAGGENIGRYTLGTEQAAMTLEMLLQSNPEVLITWSRQERDALLADPRFASLAAVQKRQVHAVPVGATPWLAPGVEQCLGVLWAAQRLHPGRFLDLDMEHETQNFYRRFFNLAIDAREAKAILDGMD